MAAAPSRMVSPNLAPPAPGATCHLETLTLPQNEANTCWWLSANLALFHTNRPEMYNYQVSLTENGSRGGIKKPFTGSNKPDIFRRELSDTFIQLSDYYKGAGAPIPMSNLIDLRLEPNMEAVFDTDQFKVAGAGVQSSDEYITTLSQYLGFDRGLISINPGRATGALDTYAYDIQLHANHFGIPHIEETENKYNISYSQIASDVSTLILTCGRIATEGKTSIPITPLKEITVPTFNFRGLSGPDVGKYLHSLTNPPDVSKNANLIQYPYKESNIAQYTETGTFFLDAMVVYEPGHYVAYAKCNKSDVWYYYKAIQEGALGDINSGNKSFPNFDAMMAADGDKIKANFTHLMYSKEEDDVSA